MECTCIRYTELPHTTNLFADLIYHPDRVASFYPHSPYDPSSYDAAAAQITFSAEQRSSLVSALRDENGDSPSLRLLAQSGTVAVVTGQQVGLFSGPAYTIYKALTAVKLARDLTARGITAVPMFWLATEDHDFAEINHCWIFDSAHHPAKLEINGELGSNQPVGQVQITASPVAELRSALRDLPFAEEITALVEDAYAPGRTLGEAFGALLGRLLQRYDILRIDPMSWAIRQLAAPAIRSAVSMAPELTAQVLQRNRELAEAGYHAQVHVEDQTSFVFLLQDGKRIALRRDGTDYVTQGRRFSTQELLDRADELSPNALLRPVVQDSILPTVAYIGGPAELAYLAQAEVIYRKVLGRMPIALHRSGFTLLDQRSRKLMERYKLSLTDFFHTDDGFKERISALLVPAAIARSLQEIRTIRDQTMERVARELSGFDPTLVKAVEKSRRKIQYQFDKIERKIGREILARDAKATRDADYLKGLVYPHRHLQERLYSIVPFLAKHGLNLVDRLYENVHLECPDHQLLVVD